MDFRLLEEITDLREAFIRRFVMPWEEFQVRLADWIAVMAQKKYSIDIDWYERSYFWDRMSPDFPRVSLDEALAFLRARCGPVYFMAEKGEETYYCGKRIVDFIAEADAHALADRIHQEWFDSYRLAAQNMYDPDAFLPDDLYVFDSTMTWCVVFTHETTDWESELDNPMKAAESRYCIICEV